ncbi:MAG TPA: hypothetical protein VGD50_01805 [Candidatus Baltobacteraceae bacterium]
MPLLQREAFLGFEEQTFAQFTDRPQELAWPTTQDWLNRVFADFGRAVQSTSDRTALKAIRHQLEDGAHLSRAAMLQQGMEIDERYVRSLPTALRDSFLLGSIVQQIYFNAGVLKDETANASDLAFVRTAGVLDQLVPDLGPARRALAQSTSLPDSEAVAANVRALLLRPIPGVRVSDNAIVAVAARALLITSDGPRKGTGHTFLELVHADGSVETIGGYPDGIYDFGREGRMTCSFDLEPKLWLPQGLPSLYPTPPPGRDIAALGQQLLDACRAFNAHPPLRYSPLGGNGESNDNSLTMGLLRTFATQSDFDEFSRGVQ